MWGRRVLATCFVVACFVILWCIPFLSSGVGMPAAAQRGMQQGHNAVVVIRYGVCDSVPIPC